MKFFQQTQMMVGKKLKNAYFSSFFSGNYVRIRLNPGIPFCGKLLFQILRVERKSVFLMALQPGVYTLGWQIWAALPSVL